MIKIVPKELITITQEDKHIQLIEGQKCKVINMPFSKIVKDPFYIDFNCPVELESYSIIEPLDGDYANVSIKFRNKTGKQISAIKFDVYFYNIFYEPVDIGNGYVSEIVFLDLQLEPSEVLASENVFKIPCSDNIRRVKVIVKKVVYDNGIRWLYDEEDLIEVETAFLDGKEIENLQIVMGDDAICYPRKENSYWQCVCGNVNSYDNDLCSKCKKNCKHVFGNAINNKEVIEKYKKAALEKQEKQRQQEKASDKYTVVIAIFLVVIVVIITFVAALS